MRYLSIYIFILSLIAFPIVLYADIKVLTPNGGEVLIKNENYKITWEGGADKVDILGHKCTSLLGGGELCYPGVTLASGIDNVGSYDWKVNLFSEVYPFKIAVKGVNATTSDESDVSDAVFSIADYPELDLSIDTWFNGDTADLTNVPGDRDVQIIWKVHKANSCQASGDWSGLKKLANSSLCSAQG